MQTPKSNGLQVYVNGGCGFLAADGSSADNVPGCEVLAWFADPEVAERIGQAGSPTRQETSTTFARALLLGAPHLRCCIQICH